MLTILSKCCESLPSMDLCPVQSDSSKNGRMQCQCCAGVEGMSFFFTWMRLSSMKQLDWYRNSSYQSKDIAHVQKTITQRIADKVREHR